MKVLAVALEGGKSSQASLNYANVGLRLRFLLSVDSHTLVVSSWLPSEIKAWLLVYILHALQSSLIKQLDCLLQ